MDAKRINELLVQHRDELLEDTVPFWMRHAVDNEHGGYLTYLDADGTVLCTDKPVWLLGRFAWLMSRLYNDVEQREEWLRTSEHGVRFILEHCFDTDGRMFYEVTRDGRPLRKRRYLFTEVFGIIALAEYARAARDEQVMEGARRLYQLFVCYYQHPELLPPKFYPQTRQLRAHVMPMVLLTATQVIRRYDSDALYDRMAQQAVDEVRRYFVHPELEAVLETVGPQGEVLRDLPEGRIINAGHAIESGWFILEEARHRRNDPELIQLGCTIIDWSLELGWDPEYGGIRYFVDIDGKPPAYLEHDMKLAWPHNEALYGTLLAHDLTGQERYAQWYERIHEWAYARFPDRQHGDWFKYLHRDGSVSLTTKGNRFVGPFHLPRQQLYCWKLLEQMKARSS